MTVWAQTTPSIWTVGSASALTVGVVTGATGAVSASAWDASTRGVTRPAERATTTPAARRRNDLLCVTMVAPAGAQCLTSEVREDFYAERRQHGHAASGTQTESAAVRDRSA